MTKNILLVEDDRYLADIYVTKLEKEGFKVDLAKDGLEALDFLQKNKPDLLILDIVIPCIDGWEILRRVRKKKEFKKLPIIIFSNLDQKREVMKGVDLGATKYMIKANFTPKEILAEVKKMLK